MKLDRLTQTWTGAIAENRFHRIVTLVLAIAVAGLAFGSLRQNTAVVLVPPTLDAEALIARDDAQQEYKQAWGLYLAEMLGNVTPDNVDFIGKAIGPLLAPDIYHAAMEVMQNQALQIKQDRISLRFTPREVKYEKPTGKVFVEGYTFAAGVGGSEERKMRTFEFIVRIKQYAPMVTHIDTYDGRARTEDVLRRESEHQDKHKDRH